MGIWRAVVTVTSPDLGGTGVNVWHIRDDGTVNPDPGLNNRIDALHDFYTACANAFCGTTTIDFGGDLVLVDGTEPTLKSGLHNWSVVGGTTTPNLPPANCICVSWKTDLAGRSGRGRTFLGPISKDALEDNGTPVEAVREFIQAAGNALIASDSPPDNGAFVVWSPKTHTGRDLAGVNVPNEFAVLRSRRD